jgi:hypothetical protein
VFPLSLALIRQAAGTITSRQVNITARYQKLRASAPLNRKRRLGQLTYDQSLTAMALTLQRHFSASNKFTPT